jgi:hypothetical protein
MVEKNEDFDNTSWGLGSSGDENEYFEYNADGPDLSQKNSN